MRPRLTLAALGLTLPALLTVGCVSQQETDQFRKQYRVAQEQILDLQATIEDKDRQIELLRNTKNPNVDLQSRIAELQTEKSQLETALATARDQLARAGTTPIPVELADELEQLAQDNSDLMSYDKETGAIRFRSDVTFGLGSADVRDSAKPIIQKLADVLSSPVAAEYEVRVVGHTDNVPMRNAMNIQRFGDNWGLSTARARGVMQQFSQAGISEQRMSIAGYGEFRPVEPNGPRGSEANRRVEIFLVPMPEADVTSDTAAETSEAAEPEGDRPEPGADATENTVVPMKRPAPPASDFDNSK
jgi:chemotaxis protein MotB